MRYFKCHYCGACKPLSEFYITTKTGTASPYCKLCNTDAMLVRSYKAKLKKVGATQFALDIRRRRHQLKLMMNTLDNITSYE